MGKGGGMGGKDSLYYYYYNIIMAGGVHCSVVCLLQTSNLMFRTGNLPVVLSDYQTHCTSQCPVYGIVSAGISYLIAELAKQRIRHSLA